MFIVFYVKTCYMCKKVPFTEINDSPLWEGTEKPLKFFYV